MVARSDVEHLLVDAIEVFPAFGAEVQTLEGLERFRGSRFMFENRKVTGDCRIGIVDDVGQNFSEAEMQLDELVRIVDDCDTLAQYVGKLLEVTLLVVDTIQESQCLGVVGVETQNLVKNLLGPRQIAKLGFEHCGQAYKHVFADSAVIGLRRRLDHGGDVRFPLMGRAGQAQCLVKGLLGRGRFHDGACPPIEGRDLVHESIFSDVRQTAQDALALF